MFLKANTNQYCPPILQFYLANTAPPSSGKIEASFQVILLHGPCLLLGGPYYEPLLWFMINSWSKKFIWSANENLIFHELHSILHLVS